MSNSKAYKLKVDTSILTCTISVQKYSTATFKVSGEEVTSFSGTSGEEIDFTVTGGDYINAYVNVTYDKNTYNETSSQCNICFILATNSSFIWQATGKLAQGDNPSIFTSGNGANSTEHTSNVLEAVTPTEKNPSVPPSAAQVLNATQVYIVDYNAVNKNILVRGNSPLGKESEGNQLIDFNALEQAIQTACEAASIDPEMSSYVLHDISLLSSAEEYIWANEYYSFGNTGVPSMDKRTWFPVTPTQLPGVTGTKTGNWCRWNIQPDEIGQSTADLVQELSGFMKVKNDVLHIYYVHCASGHDRTGMVSATYIADTDTDTTETLDKAFVMGTTLVKQASGGGDIVADCNTWGTTTPNTLKSRCFMADAAYSTTFSKAMNILSPKGAPYTLGSNAKRTPSGSTKPYVINGYPFPQDM